MVEPEFKKCRNKHIGILAHEKKYKEILKKALFKMMNTHDNVEAAFVGWVFVRVSAHPFVSPVVLRPDLACPCLNFIMG